MSRQRGVCASLLIAAVLSYAVLSATATAKSPADRAVVFARCLSNVKRSVVAQQAGGGKAYRLVITLNGFRGCAVQRNGEPLLRTSDQYRMGPTAALPRMRLPATDAGSVGPLDASERGIPP